MMNTLDPPLQLSVCFGTYNRLEMLRGCVESVRKAAGSLSYEVVITDGGSTDGTLEWLKNLTPTLSINGEGDTLTPALNLTPTLSINGEGETLTPNLNLTPNPSPKGRGEIKGEVVLIEHGELRGAVQAYYDAFQFARGEYMCYLSDDLIVPAGMFEKAVEYLRENPQCGVVSLPYKNPTQGVEKLIYATVGNKRLPFASFGVLRRAEGEAVDWMPRATYHFYLDVGICLNIQKLGLKVEALPGDYVIQHLMGDNIDRGRGRDSKYSSMRDAEAFHEYWEGRI